MKKSQEHFEKLLRETNTSFHRYLHSKINWNSRMIGLTGPRGVGKTTLVLQHIKEELYRKTYVMKDDIEAGYMNVVMAIGFGLLKAGQGGISATPVVRGFIIICNPLCTLPTESRIIKYKIRQKCEYLYSMPYISSNE